METDRGSNTVRSAVQEFSFKNAHRDFDAKQAYEKFGLKERTQKKGVGIHSNNAKDVR